MVNGHLKTGILMEISSIYCRARFINMIYGLRRPIPFPHSKSRDSRHRQMQDVLFAVFSDIKAQSPKARPLESLTDGSNHNFPHRRTGTHI